MLEASLNEVGLVALFVAVVLLASKAGKVGEAVGRMFDRDEGSPPRGEGGGGGEKTGR